MKGSDDRVFLGLQSSLSDQNGSKCKTTLLCARDIALLSALLSSYWWSTAICRAGIALVSKQIVSITISVLDIKLNEQ